MGEKRSEPKPTDEFPIVGPLNPDPEERQYWQDVQNLVADYCAQKSDPLSDEGAAGLYLLAGWAAFRHEAGEEWTLEWDGRFNAGTLERLDARSMLLEDGLAMGLWRGQDPAAVVDEIVEFVSWLGHEKGFPGPVCGRVLREIEEARPRYVGAFREESSVFDARDDRCPDCAREEAVAPFVVWLREGGAPMERLLLGQSLCADALEQLHSPSIVNADWDKLDILACLQYTSRQLPYPDLENRDLRAVGYQFLDFLRENRLLSRKSYRRLYREAGRRLEPLQ